LLLTHRWDLRKFEIRKKIKWLLFKKSITETTSKTLPSPSPRSGHVSRQRFGSSQQESNRNKPWALMLRLKQVQQAP